MGFVFLLLLIAGIIVKLVHYTYTEEEMSSKDKKNRKEGVIIGSCICAVAFLMIMGATWGTSYDSHVTMQERLVNIDAYKHAINIYADKGVAEFKSGGVRMSTELTDLKYQNYQVQLGEMIVSLRRQIVYYNEAFIGKREFGSNWFWGWCIIGPPDGYKPLRMEDYIK